MFRFSPLKWCCLLLKYNGKQPVRNNLTIGTAHMKIWRLNYIPSSNLSLRQRLQRAHRGCIKLPSNCKASSHQLVPYGSFLWSIFVAFFACLFLFSCLRMRDCSASAFLRKMTSAEHCAGNRRSYRTGPTDRVHVRKNGHIVPHIIEKACVHYRNSVTAI